MFEFGVVDTVYGQLETGELVTLWDLQNHHLQHLVEAHNAGYSKHRRSFTYAILGDHLKSHEDQTFRFSAFRLHGLNEWSRMTEPIPRGLEPQQLGEILHQVKRQELVANLDQVPFAGVRWYAEGVYHRDTLPAADVKTKVLQRIELDDIVYNRMWATKASFGRVKQDAAGCLVTNDFPIFVVDRDKALPAYVELLFRHTSFQEAASIAATGTTERRRLNERDFVKINVSLPQTDEQHRIVDLIGAVDDAIEAAESTQMDRLNLRDALADAAFAKARDSHGVMTTLAAVVGARGFIQTGPFGSQLHSHDYVEAGTPVVMPANIRNGRVNTDGIARISQADVQRLAKHKVKPGDIVWSRRGDVTRFARITEDDEPMICGTGCLLIRPEKPETTSWLSVWLSSKSMQNLITDRAVGATMLNLNTTILSNLPVAVPDETSGPLGKLPESIGVSDLAGVRHLEVLRNLRNELLSALLSGAHRIPETYDELIGADSMETVLA